MKLYYSPGACSLSPHIVLCETGLTCELVRVDLETKRTADGEDFRKLNPLGYVPALVLENGRILLEGPAIVQYLADQAPEKQLAPPAGTYERYVLQQWLNFISTELHQGCGALFLHDLPEAAKLPFRTRLEKRLAYTATHLTSQHYLLGDTFTAADAYLFVVLSWRDFVGFDISPWPVLVKYFDGIADRPAVREALRQEGLTL